MNIIKEELKGQLHKFKEFWRSLLKRFQEMIGFNKGERYKYVSDDLYRNGMFDDNDNEIANDIARKVKTVDEINNSKKIERKIIIQDFNKETKKMEQDKVKFIIDMQTRGIISQVRKIRRGK